MENKPRFCGGKFTKDKSSFFFNGDNYNEEELEFIKAVDRYKREKNRLFPSYTEILDVLLSLGYRKTKDQSNCE